MKVCIIGGGISGLYLGYLLSKKRHIIDIFEKNSKLGGRVLTETYKINEQNISYEAGAGRFNKTHKKLLKLLKHLKLYDNVQPIKMEREFKINSRKSNYDNLVSKILFTEILEKSNNYSIEYLKSITLKEFMELIVGKQKTQQVIDAFGYNSEFELQNAYTSLKIFEHDFNDEIQYFYLQGGLSQIINKLSEKIVSNKDNNIYTNTEVLEYDYNTNHIKYRQYKKIQVEKYDKVIFCITKQTLLKFNDLLAYDRNLRHYLDNSIEMSPLHRIFAVFPTNEHGLAWFHDIKRTTTNLPIRYIIPMNAHNGLLQISYTDKEYADYWNSFESDDKLIDELLKSLNTLFPNKIIPRPLWIKKHYWKEGATYWKPNYKVYKNKKLNKYYIAGELTSQFHTGWIEGALESADRLLKYF